MSSSQSKIQDLLYRFRSEQQGEQHVNMDRPTNNGQKSRPVLLGNIIPKRPEILKFSPRHNDPTETDEKLKEIMKTSGNIKINGIAYQTDIKDMEHLGELGYGTCGHVVKMRHKPSGEIIAVKQMRRSGCSEENKRIIMDIEVVLQSHDCPYIVQCLGCFITESEVWICMELMATCFDKLLKRLKKSIPENILGKVTIATVKALHYLKVKHRVIHRDVKPSNILLDERGNIKLCDFGISGRLVDSMAKTKSAGCAAYMAPERIEPDPQNPDYDIRADVWSLGITLVELATGELPYQNCKSDFEVLSCVVAKDPPRLPENMDFSQEFRKFVACCLRKDRKQRPKYEVLSIHEFLKKYENDSVHVGEWFSQAVRQVELIGANNSAPRFTSSPIPSTRRHNNHTQHSFINPTDLQHPPNCTNGNSTTLYLPPSSSTSSSASSSEHPLNIGLPPDGRSFHNSRLASFHHNSTNHQREQPSYQRSSSHHQSTDRSPRNSMSPPETTGRLSPGPEKIRQQCFSPSFSRSISSPHPNVQDPGGNYSPYTQRRFNEAPAGSTMSPYQQRRKLMGDTWWHSPSGSPLPVRNHLPSTEQPYNHGNTSPIVLQRFYHQQKQHQQQAARDAEGDGGKKRFASCIKLQLGGECSGRSSRHQSPEPPPRLSRAVSGDSSNNPSPLAVRRNFMDNSSPLPSLSRRHVSPSPPVPPPRRLSESNSVPGSPQHVRARIHYTPELHRRFYRNNDVS